MKISVNMLLMIKASDIDLSIPYAILQCFGPATFNLTSTSWSLFISYDQPTCHNHMALVIVHDICNRLVDVWLAIDCWVQLDKHGITAAQAASGGDEERISPSFKADHASRVAVDRSCRGAQVSGGPKVQKVSDNQGFFL